jgi:ribulose-phosphate 3-epimerase
MPMSIIVPSILEKTEDALTARVRAIEQVTDVAQLDVLDHTFLPFRTFYDPAFITGLQSKVKMEIHLMTSATPETVQVWNQPWVSRILFHLKAVPDPMPIFDAIAQMGKLAGLVLDPEASLLEAKPYLSRCDTVTIMGVPAGRSGQPIVHSTIEKVKRLRAIAPNVHIEFDGGVTDENVQSIARAGADLIVVGSYLMSDQFQERFNHLTNLIHAKGDKISENLGA